MERFIIDRIEDGIAVLEREDKSHFSVPADRLYPGAKEGDVTCQNGGKYRYDAEETERLREEAAALSRELWGS